MPDKEVYRRHGKLSRMPPFLAGVDLNHAKCIREHGPLMTNWLRIHAVIKDLPPTEESLLVLREMMVAEYYHVYPKHPKSTSPRIDVLIRLHRRYNVLRAEVERAQMMVTK